PASCYSFCRVLLPFPTRRSSDLNILHGGDGESGVLQGLLDSLRVPYTGSGVLGSALALDKIRAKQVWIAEGLPTPRWVRLAKGGDRKSTRLNSSHVKISYAGFCL